MFRCQGDPTGRLLRGNFFFHSPVSLVLFNQLGVKVT